MGRKSRRRMTKLDAKERRERARKKAIKEKEERQRMRELMSQYFLKGSARK